MLASSFLDTAIGIIFVFLLLSLIASSINELILSRLSMRGKFLLRGIKTLLDDATGTGLASAIYNHGQVFGLFGGPYNVDKPTNLPSYIPANNFVMAFLGILPEASLAVATGYADLAAKAAEHAEAVANKTNDSKDQEKARELRAKADAALDAKTAAEKTTKDTKAALSNVISSAKAGIGLPAATAAALDAAAKADAAVKASQEAMRAAEANPADTAAAEKASELAKQAEAARQLKASAAKALTEQASGVELSVAFQSWKAVASDLANNPVSEKLGKPLLELLNQAGDDLDKLKAGIEAWYNSAMDRVSGWYKYYTQWWLFGIGLVLAVALNANTINIVTQLSKDATLRQSIVAAAQSVKPPSNGDTTPDIGKIKEQIEQVNELGIPLGWHLTEADQQKGGKKPATPLSVLVAVLKSISGLLLTAVAVSMGAPFWFDLLNKIMVVRSTVKPHEKSKEEGTKDKPAK